MNYQLSEYRRRVLGCFLGKNAGGTLGMRDEWHRRINHVDGYVHEITGEPLPNDDMDIQLVWLVALEEQGVRIHAGTLADYWMYYVTPHWAEYGNCKVNMRMGLRPPFSGTVNNPYRDSCGAYIRSEIWACLAPACPEIAVRYAYEDALIDHGEGEGLYAEIFCAAMESAAFLETDLSALFTIGLSYIPESCAVAGAVRLACELYEKGVSWQEARDEILRNFLGGFIFSISEDDRRKGFTDGRVGWETPSNIGMIAIALLYGEGDFGKTICIAVNCGEDTDCTAATAGSLLGILLGIDGIPEKWRLPIGTKLKPACLNLGELGNLGSLLPKDIYELQARIERLAPAALSLYRSDVILTEPADGSCAGRSLICSDPSPYYAGPDTERFHFDFFDIDVTYIGGPCICSGCEKKIRFTVHNRYKTSENFRIAIYQAETTECGISPSAGILHVPEGVWLHNKESVTFTFSFRELTSPVFRAAAEFTTPSHAGVMLVPLLFLHNLNADTRREKSGSAEQ